MLSPYLLNIWMFHRAEYPTLPRWGFYDKMQETTLCGGYDMVLEICVDSLASARAAVWGGADRLELCSALAVGGLTPYTALLRQIRAESAVPIRCLMRPRAGDFLYTREELDLICVQMQELKDAGASGFVIGALTQDGDLDILAMHKLLKATGGLPVTLHRAIDVSRDLRHTYWQASELGIDTVLTSGGAASCTAGEETIGELLDMRESIHGPEVLIGAGVNAQVIRYFRDKYPAARAFHMSGKMELESGMRFRRTGVPMGLPGLDEWHIQQTDITAVRSARAVLDAL